VGPDELQNKIKRVRRRTELRELERDSLVEERKQSLLRHSEHLGRLGQYNEIESDEKNEMRREQEEKTNKKKQETTHTEQNRTEQKHTC
jgi:hypothetical protein